MKTTIKRIAELPAIIYGAGKLIFWASFALILVFAVNIQAQEKNADKKEIKAQQFIDEDGDGFNDLLPDSDGDGIPDMIDPDFKGHSAESLYMHRYMHGQVIEAEKNQYRNSFQHGEPGQYGPNDSTGHGQGDGREGHRGNPGSGGQGGQGDGGNNPGGGSGQNKVGAGENKPPQEVKPENDPKTQNPQNNNVKK